MGEVLPRHGLTFGDWYMRLCEELEQVYGRKMDEVATMVFGGENKAFFDTMGEWYVTRPEQIAQLLMKRYMRKGLANMMQAAQATR